MKTSTRIAKLKIKIENLRDEIKEIQESCLHQNATFKYDSDTGNWDKSQDRYWRDYHCPDCDKRWSVDS